MSVLDRLTLCCGKRLLFSASEEHVGPVFQLVFVLVEYKAWVSLSCPIHIAELVQVLRQGNLATVSLLLVLSVMVTSTIKSQ